MATDWRTVELIEAARGLVPLIEDDLGAWCYLCDSLLPMCECPAARFRAAVELFTPARAATEDREGGEG